MNDSLESRLVPVFYADVPPVPTDLLKRSSSDDAINDRFVKTENNYNEAFPKSHLLLVRHKATTAATVATVATVAATIIKKFAVGNDVLFAYEFSNFECPLQVIRVRNVIETMYVRKSGRCGDF